MKKIIPCIFLIAFFCLSAPAFAADDMQSHDMNAGTPATHTGKLIRETDVTGYHLSYHLIELQAQSNDMKGMQHDMKQISAHHLMLYIQDAEGKSIGSAQVGFLIVGPDGSEQKIMAMEMGDGYGANVNLSKPGDYAIKSKAVFADKKLLDEFTYQKQ